MKPEDRKYHFYLEDIIVSMKRIQEYIEGIDFPEFKRKYIIVDAVIRNFEIIGEATKHIPKEIQDKYPNIPWRKMYSLRNIVSHEYFGIDYEMIWEIAKNEIPSNLADFEVIIKIEKNK